MSTYPMTWEEAVAWLRTQPNQQNFIRDCFFDDPLFEAAKRYHASTEWAAVRALLPKPPGIALDIGAGRGIAAFALATDGWETVAIEPNPSNLVGTGAIRSLTRQSGIHIAITEEWGENLPFPDESFDLVHARQVLHHAADLKKLCSEMARVLKPHGICIATREHVISSPADLPVFLDSHPLHSLYGGEHAFLLEEYLFALRASGLHIRHVLSPLETDINLYPSTVSETRRHLARKLRIPLPAYFLHLLLKWKSKYSSTPGRLYTFVCEHP